MIEYSVINLQKKIKNKTQKKILLAAYAVLVWTTNVRRNDVKKPFCDRNISL